MESIYLILLVFITNLFNFVLSENTVLVETKSGPIIGFKETFDDKEVNVYLGIPYAEPPLGEHRFRVPEPIEEWTQPLIANKWPNNCIQIKSFMSFKSEVFSEDCLFLNIWSPYNKEINKDSLKPVIVFIHGGGLYIGSSTFRDGKVLSTLGDVVFVTFNYRLDAFGFLYADSDEAPGNVGLWDQVMALQWVNDNIENFGGSPKNITLMGLSAGSWSVSLHLISSQSQHLFQNAIMMSGAAYSRQNDRSNEEMKKYWLNAAISIGCAKEQEFSYRDFTPEIMECLKSASTEKILQLCTEIELSVPKLSWDRLVVIDGEFLTEKPIDLMSEIHLNETKSLLIGNVEDEGSVFLPFLYDSDKYDLHSPKKFTVEEAFKELSTLSSYFPSNLQIIGEEVSELYFFKLRGSEDYSEIIQTIGRAFGDFYIVCPTIRFAEKLFTENLDYIEVYQYHFTISSDILGVNSSWITKAYHGTDSEFVFGTPLLSANTSDLQKNVSKQMIEMFSHFARFGYPKSQNGIELKPFYAITNKVVKPYYEFSEDQNLLNNFKIGLKAIECDYLWNEYLDY